MAKADTQNEFQTNLGLTCSLREENATSGVGAGQVCVSESSSAFHAGMYVTQVRAKALISLDTPTIRELNLCFSFLQVFLYLYLHTFHLCNKTPEIQILLLITAKLLFSHVVLLERVHISASLHPPQSPYCVLNL